MKTNKLHNVKSTGFKLPENYFDSFDNQLIERLSKEAPINGITSSGYSVPEAYFNTVEERIISKITNDNKPIVRLKPNPKFYYISGIAASFVLLFSLVFNTKNTVTIDTIDTVAIESYLYLEDYSNDDLASLFKAGEISETDFIDVAINEETLNQYLESIDTEDLLFD